MEPHAKQIKLNSTQDSLALRFSGSSSWSMLAAHNAMKVSAAYLIISKF